MCKHPITIGREKANLSVQELAERIGVSRPTVARWALGQRMPRPADLRALQREIGVTATEIAAHYQGARRTQALERKPSQEGESA